MSSATQSGPTDRQSRRRAETRRKLLNAARRVMSEQGVEATSIQQITDAADVGFGSFYNHFESKDQIVDELMTELFETYEATIEQATVHLTDPAYVFSAKVRILQRAAEVMPLLGWFAVRVGMVRERFRAGLNYRLEQDIQRGVASGRFRVADIPTVVSAIRGAALMVLWDRLEGIASADSAEVLAEHLLRLVGLDADDAAHVARLPLPEVSLETLPK